MLSCHIAAPHQPTPSPQCLPSTHRCGLVFIWGVLYVNGALHTLVPGSFWFNIRFVGFITELDGFCRGFALGAVQWATKWRFHTEGNYAFHSGRAFDLYPGQSRGGMAVLGRMYQEQRGSFKVNDYLSRYCHTVVNCTCWRYCSFLLQGL